ncbi:hypothetical protein BJX61DRAFT_532705 [Aspergillus egyptiacus]|nr:hypothetical protein BJX61DRAFT_532705 [Aspergillus egyptiacus]
MEKRTILFLTNSDLGQASVCLAIAHEFLMRESYEVHIASFKPLETAVIELNSRAATLAQTLTTKATFHCLPGRHMVEAATGGVPVQDSFNAHEIGFLGALRAYRTLMGYIVPWTEDEYIAAYNKCVEIIRKTEPTVVVADTLLGQAIDACRNLQRQFVILSPNALKDHVVQPRLGNLWKYPILCSGYSFPLAWWQVLPNSILAITLGFTLSKSRALQKLNERRRKEGIKGTFPLMNSPENKATPMLLGSRAEIDFPSSSLENITLCGPILRPCAPIAEQCPELAKWLAQRPTVLVNLGSNVSFSETQARKFAQGLHMLFQAVPNIQVLWKLKPNRTDKMGDWIAEALPGIISETQNGRLRIESWLPVDPFCVLQSGHVVCMVHHGGANSYNEAVRAGVPQVILPTWFDTFDYAARIEYLGVGVWGNKETAPEFKGPDVGEALMQDKAKSIASKIADSEGRLNLRPHYLLYLTTMASETVSWIGLGNIGRGMSRNIAIKGPQKSPLILYNRTASKASAFAASLTSEKPQSAIVAPSLPAAVKDASISFICVGDDAAVDQIIDTLTSDKTLNLKDKLIVDCSTVHPDTSRRTHTTLASHGATFIACPVFGAPNAADAGQMVVVPAGPSDAINRIKPFLEGVTSKAVLDLGPQGEQDVGRATLLKVLGNTFILNTVETLAEGLVAAEKSGLGTEVYQQWVNTMFPGPFAKYADRMATGEYFKREEPLFAVDLARKDLRHAADIGQKAGVVLPSVKTTDEYLKVVKEEKGVKGDIAGVYGAIRKEAGLPFDNQ